MKIAASNKTITGLENHDAWRRIFGILSWINIYNPNRSSRDLYATTIHELAHASHWNIDHSDFNNTSDKVKESWCRGVQWELTRMVYFDYRGGGTLRPDYTQVVVDMIDPNYPSSSFSDNLTNGLWNDNVTGYTIRQIEDALAGATSWDSWKNRIKSKYNNGTENNLDALFNYWN